MEVCDKSITMRIETSLLNEFKAIVGNKYQAKIKQLMRKYVEEMKQEEAKRVMKDKSIMTDFLTK